VHSATQPEISSPTFGAPGRELGFRFLLVFLLSMMVQIVERRAKTLVDFVVEEEATSSTPQVPNRPVPGTAAVHAARQHTTAQISRTPLRATPGALSATRELLRHPPSSMASPGAMKQWRDDVDRLLGMAHTTSTRSRPRSSRCQHEASASVCSPSVWGAQTNDLRAELNRRHAGEDARVSLERAREHRQDIEGLNLDQDFAAAAPQTPMGTRSQAGVPLVGVGCAALVDHLRATLWPPKFWPHLPEKYDGTTNPSEFLQVYVTAITAAGGNTAVMATYFHVALSGPARTWLMNLTLGSIYSWEELCAWFIVNFASAYQQHGVEAHLHVVRQEPGETLRTFISRFTKVRGTIPRISDASIITTFRQGVRDKKMLEKLATHDVETVPTLFALADKCARAAEGRVWHSAPQTGLPKQVAQVPSLRTTRKRRKRTAATRSRTPPLWSWQLRLGAGATTRNTHGHQGVTATHAPCNPTVATAPQNVARSSTSRSVSARGASSLPGMAPHLVADPVRKRPTTKRWPRPNRTSGISHPRES
jgi:hypothetical protein